MNCYCPWNFFPSGMSKFPPWSVISAHASSVTLSPWNVVSVRVKCSYTAITAHTTAEVGNKLLLLLLTWCKTHLRKTKIVFSWGWNINITINTGIHVCKGTDEVVSLLKIVSKLIPSAWRVIFSDRGEGKEREEKEEVLLCIILI